MERKIIKVGNSLGVIIPSTLLEEMGIGYQDVVNLEYSKELKSIVITNKNTTPSDNHLDKVVKGIVDDYLKEKGY